MDDNNDDNQVSNASLINTLLSFTKNHIRFFLFITALLLLGIVSFSYIKSYYLSYISSRSEADVTSLVLKRTAENDALATKGIFLPQDQKAAIIGTETIYNKDLNYIAYKLLVNDFESRKTAADFRKIVLPLAIEQSVLLQSSYSKSVPADTMAQIFDKYDKNYQLRIKTVNSLQRQLTNNQTTINGASISVWYHNMSQPPIVTQEGNTPEYAQELAWKVIASLRAEIKRLNDAGKTLKEAFNEVGTGIQADVNNARSNFYKNIISDLVRLDPTSYKGNGYFEFSDKKKGQIIFSKPVIDQVLWSLPANKISGIIQVPKFKAPSNTSNEEFFTILGVFDKTNSDKGSYKDLLNNESKNFTIKDCSIDNCN
jgi:hypothetical protein